MRSNDDIERYLMKMDLPYEQIGEGMWVIHDEYEKIENMVVMHTPPVVVFRVKLMDLPPKPSSELLKTFLRLNASEMVAGAYGIEDNAVVVIDSLQSENLDYNEFQASVDALTMAITQHYPKFKEFRTEA